MRRISIAVALALLTLSGCGGADKPAAAASSPPEMFTVTGSMTLGLGDFEGNTATQTCWGKGGFDDMKAGTQVVVSDPAGATIAVGSMLDGQTQYGDLEVGGEPLQSSCQISFIVKNVPAGKGFYGVEVSHRGRLQYTESEARQGLKLTLE